MQGNNMGGGIDSDPLLPGSWGGKGSRRESRNSKRMNSA